MFIVFHQNMMIFNGKKAVRNAHYQTQMGLIGAAITAAHGGPRVGAAGYTELINAEAAMRGNLLAIAQALDAGLTRRLIIEVGTMAVSGKSEYLGIAWDPDVLTVQHAGQVVWDSMHERWIGNNTAAGGFAAANNTLDLDGVDNLGADQRGIAYIACRRAVNGNRFIIAFLHNMFSEGDRNRAMAGMDAMISRAKSAAGDGYAAAEIIVGGDFNVRPPAAAQSRLKRRRGAGLTVRVTRNLAGAALNTTQWHPYDYWIVSDSAGISDDDTDLYTQTRWDVDEECSDHAGVTVDRS